MVQGHLRSDAERYGALRLTPRSRPLLRGEERIWLREDPAARRVARRVTKTARADSYQVPAHDEPLWESLRELRMTLCREANVPPYVIFHDATLREMVRLRPSSPSELLAVQGVGETKLERYGEAFLEGAARAREPPVYTGPAPPGLITSSLRTLNVTARMARLIATRIPSAHLTQAMPSPVLK